MKSLFISLALLTGIASASCRSGMSDIGGVCQTTASTKPTVVYLVSESQYRFQTLATGSRWFIVDAATVGATNFDRMHASLSTGVLKGCDMWFSATSVESATPDYMTQMSLYGTCNFH